MPYVKVAEVDVVVRRIFGGNKPAEPSTFKESAVR